VQREEVDLAQHGAGSDDALAVLEEVCAKSLDKRGGVVGAGAGGDFGVEILWDGLPDVTLKDVNDLRGLLLSARVYQKGAMTYLEVNVLQSPHDNAVQRILREVELGVLLEALNIDEGTDKLSIQQCLIG
jgi:hypothetical protein